MDGSVIAGIAIAITAAIVAVIVISRAKRSKKNALEKLAILAPDIASLYREASRLSDFDSGYLMKKDWGAFTASAAPVLKSISKIPMKTVEASTYAEQITFVKTRCENPHFREERNGDYKARELERCNALLSDIDGGKSLDPQQRDAVVTDEYSNLVIAGAGSGKTSVVVGKVKYLVNRWGVDPSEILVECS